MQRRLLHHSQMFVTALTETGDYTKAHAACCKRARHEINFIFSGREENSIHFFNIEAPLVHLAARVSRFESNGQIQDSGEHNLFREAFS